MAAGETHRYSIALRAGEYLQLLVEQHDVDVHQTLTGPDGAVILETDCPCQFLGRTRWPSSPRNTAFTSWP